MPTPADPIVAALIEALDADEYAHERGTAADQDRALAALDLARDGLSAVVVAARAVVASASRDRSDFIVRVGRRSFDRIASAITAADAIATARAARSALEAVDAPPEAHDR